jgi:hypothetical protein
MKNNRLLNKMQVNLFQLLYARIFLVVRKCLNLVFFLILKKQLRDGLGDEASAGK